MLNNKIKKKIKFKKTYKNILKNYENQNKKTLDIKISVVDCYSKIQNLSAFRYMVIKIKLDRYSKVRECHNSVCKHLNIIIN